MSLEQTVESVAWYYGYISIYLFLLGFLNYESSADGLVSKIPFAANSINYVQNYQSTDFSLCVLTVSLWALHHSITLRPSVSALISKLLPSFLNDGTLYQLLSASILNLVTWQWFGFVFGNMGHRLAQKQLSTVIWDLGAMFGIPAELRSEYFWFYNVVTVASLILYTYTEYYALTSGIYEKETIIIPEVNKGKKRKEQGFSPYLIVRHPMQVSFLCIFWLSPLMTLHRFQLAALLTFYIVIGTHFEERDLVAKFGKKYREYQKVVPKFIPYRLVWS